jgi:hypothetical protein
VLQKEIEKLEAEAKKSDSEAQKNLALASKIQAENLKKSLDNAEKEQAAEAASAKKRWEHEERQLDIAVKVADDDRKAAQALEKAETKKSERAENELKTAVSHETAKRHELQKIEAHLTGNDFGAWKKERDKEIEYQAKGHLNEQKLQYKKSTIDVSAAAATSKKISRRRGEARTDF